MVKNLFKNIFFGIFFVTFCHEPALFLCSFSIACPLSDPLVCVSR